MIVIGYGEGLLVFRGELLLRGGLGGSTKRKLRVELGLGIGCFRLVVFLGIGSLSSIRCCCSGLVVLGLVSLSK